MTKKQAFQIYRLRGMLGNLAHILTEHTGTHHLQENKPTVTLILHIMDSIDTLIEAASQGLAAPEIEQRIANLALDLTWRHSRQLYATPNHETNITQ